MKLLYNNRKYYIVKYNSKKRINKHLITILKFKSLNKKLINYKMKIKRLTKTLK